MLKITVWKTLSEEITWATETLMEARRVWRSYLHSYDISGEE
jgi:hypothetical protein